MPRGLPEPWPSERIELAASLYQSRHSLYQVARKVKSTPETVRRVLVEHGVKMRQGAEAQIENRR